MAVLSDPQKDGSSPVYLQVRKGGLPPVERQRRDRLVISQRATTTKGESLLTEIIQF
jgi:hypothetical protein